MWGAACMSRVSDIDCDMRDLITIPNLAIIIYEAFPDASDLLHISVAEPGDPQTGAPMPISAVALQISGNHHFSNSLVSTEISECSVR